jgi:arylsulfatase A-like enzyme
MLSALLLALQTLPAEPPRQPFAIEPARRGGPVDGAALELRALPALGLADSEDASNPPPPGGLDERGAQAAPRSDQDGPAAPTAELEAGAGADAAPPRPNLLLFMVDDLGWRDHSLDLGFGPDVPPTHFRTPHLERLAAEGAIFTNGYAACPVCTPSRVAWMTGRRPARSNITYWVFDADRDTSATHPTLSAPDWRTEGMQPDDPSLPRYLAEAGYRTIHVGKAHFGATGSPGEDPLALGFDVNIAGHGRGAPGSYLGTDHFQSSRRQGSEGPGPWDVPGLERYHGQDIFLTEALALEAAEQIRAAKAADQPFFMNFAPYAVHTPIQANAKYLASYPELDEREAAYATMVESVDAALGVLLDTLRDEGVLDNTLIVYTSDNGGLSAHARGGEANTHNLPLKSGKGSAYEGGTRVPLVARWPGRVEPGTRRADLVVSNDLFITFVSASGARPSGSAWSPGMRGIGLFDDRRGLLNEQPPFTEGTATWHMPHQWGASGPGIQPFSSIRHGRYKLIHWHAGGPLELYDLVDDPGESRNLATELPDVLRELAERLERALVEDDAQRSIQTATGEPVPGAVELLPE